MKNSHYLSLCKFWRHVVKCLELSQANHCAGFTVTIIDLFSRRSYKLVLWITFVAHFKVA